MIDIKNIKNIGIIGSGVAGLAAARLLSQAGFDCEIFEKGKQVGGVWTVGYNTFGLQTPRSLYEIPDFPFPDDYPRIPSGPQLQAYFEAYAKKFKLLEKTSFDSEVQSLQPVADSGWRLTTKDLNSGKTKTKNFDFIVVATGLYSTPFVPEVPGHETFRGEILHSSEYKSPELVKARDVVVVGFGKSALDIATDATRYAKTVSLVFREPHWPVPVDVLNLIDVRRIFLNRLAGGFLPLYQQPEAWEKRLHKYCPLLIKGFWRFVEILLKAQFPLKACDALPNTPPESDFFNQDFLPRPETYRLMKSGKISCRRARISNLTEDGIQLDNGDIIDSDRLIFGTGWKPDYAYLPEAFQQSVGEDGVYLYRHILHPAMDNCAFLGWASTFSNSLTAHLASLWLVQLLKGTLNIPDKAGLESEIQSLRDWKRGFMPSNQGRASMLQLHMWHYHDELMRDIGVDPYRKSNKIAEWLQYYGPSDYRDLCSTSETV